MRPTSRAPDPEKSAGQAGGMPRARALGLGDVRLKLTRPIAPSKGVNFVLKHLPFNQFRLVPPTCGPVPRLGYFP